jgi:Ser/Thr protein kinase RdoA (MazF antagonist)
VEPHVYERDGFAVTFWSYYRPVTDLGSPAEYADALHRLHAAMRSIEIEAPHFTERIAAAERLLTHRHETPGLADDDRLLLLDTLHAAGQAIRRHVNMDQLLHGEPHPGNLLSTPRGLLFTDLETCCRGPIEITDLWTRLGIGWDLNDPVARVHLGSEANMTLSEHLRALPSS